MIEALQSRAGSSTEGELMRWRYEAEKRRRFWLTGRLDRHKAAECDLELDIIKSELIGR